MKKPFLIIFALIGTLTFGQNLKCKDFKNGIFTIEVSIPFKVKGKITRNGNEQSELFSDLPIELKGSGLEGKTIYGRINWIDDCSYRLIYDESKYELSELEKLVNSLGGILTELIKIEGNCFYYKSSFIYNDNEQVINGIICKD